MLFGRLLMQVEVKVCCAYGARTMLGNQVPALPGWADVLATDPTGLKPRNIPKTGLQNCRSLGFARDDKGEGDVSIESGC